MNILVTGGLGFIGSHTIVELVKNNHTVVIVDNLMNSKIEVLDKLNLLTSSNLKLYQIDVTNEIKIEEIFKNHKLDGVIHFAGFKAVGESVENPLEYYYNNVVSTMVLSKMCIKYGVDRFVFSSSATVYGNQQSPFREDMELKITTNPYGETKVMSERILMDVVKANPNFSVSLLRYFNPVGAHKSGLIGENPNGIPNNLLPYISKVAKGELEKLSIFGDDYDTEDGTGIRDYIHVVDLAEGHVKSIENLRPGVNIFNLGTGKGTSVLELVKAFEQVNGMDVPFEIVGRRDGDIAICFADVSKAEKVLKWKAKLGIEEMVGSAWEYEKQN
jgi:UDP-glucose 4-epimerase